MKNLRLTPYIHKQQAIIRADFVYDSALVDLVKKQKGIRWSQSLKTWYFIEKDFDKSSKSCWNSKKSNSTYVAP
jgi:hypothetical protein